MKRFVPEYAKHKIDLLKKRDFPKEEEWLREDLIERVEKILWYCKNQFISEEHAIQELAQL